jgi:hypothetical protein
MQTTLTIQRTYTTKNLNFKSFAMHCAETDLPRAKVELNVGLRAYGSIYSVLIIRQVGCVRIMLMRECVRIMLVREYEDESGGCT